ncbi:CobW family GTP-binding protein [Streptomyces sp. NPDC102406]|uniref:CobW family GTP-binding protein n=1 Tax=Streptomyces sp. NPDC102406 TaxID=3366171 RepID=UPI0037F4FBC8
MSEESPQIPVVVLAGFLGSGKTTLLNHLLHHSGGSRIGAIVNDFGAIEIDAMAVAGQLGDSTVSLGNGCLCCAVDAGELDAYLDKLTRPINAGRDVQGGQDVQGGHDSDRDSGQGGDASPGRRGMDVIVIEASGIAEPQELVRMVLASENPRIVYGGLIEVVDAAEFDATREKHPEVDRHLGMADLVVVNKSDRVPDTERRRVLGAVRESAGSAAVVSASYGRVDPELLFDCRPSRERVGQLSFDDLHRHDGTGAQNAHLHSAYESVAFTSEVPMEPRALMGFLDSRPEGLYRIKGYVDFGAADADHRYAVHAVGRFLRFYPEPWPTGEARLTQLVLIGAGIDPEALRKELEGCRATSDAPHAVDEHGMWGVLRYVQDKGSTEEATAEVAEAGDLGDLP